VNRSIPSIGWGNFGKDHAYKGINNAVQNFSVDNSHYHRQKKSSIQNDQRIIKGS